MSPPWPVIALVAPLFTAMLVSVFGLWKRALSLPLCVAGLGVSLWAALETLWQVALNGPLRYDMGGWAPPVGIVLYVDTLSAVVMVLIAAVALLMALVSWEEIAREHGEKVSAYYTLYLLFVTGVAGIALTGDAFNLYVLIEVSSLTSYALIGFGSPRAAHASFNYLMIGMLGACFYLLGVGYLLVLTGSLNMIDLHAQIRLLGLEDSPALHAGFALIMVGIWTKMALFPLHGWLPNAYTHSPYSSANLIAPLMTKVMVYVMARMVLMVFGVDYVFGLPWSEAIVVLASIAIVAGSLLALAQTDLRRMLAYLIVAEVGYMVGGFWLANLTGMVGALYHIVSDAAMTACLFVAVMLVTRHTGKRDLNAFEGLFGSAPASMTIFVIGALSMIGLPPTCGFFSKWYLISGGIEAGQWLYVGALLFSSLMNAILFFRLIEKAFFGETPTNTLRTPIRLLIPSGMLGTSLLLIGWFNRDIVELLQQTLAIALP